MPTTTRLALPYPASTSPADVPADIQALANALDTAVLYSQGVDASKPAAATQGKFYWATDTSTLYVDSGSSWIPVGIPAQDGSVTAPGVRFAADTNTGIYRPGADRMAFATNGTKALEIAADGKILIGNATDSNLYRASAGTIQTDGSLVVAGLTIGSTKAATVPQIVTTLPASPSVGDVVIYTADATNGVYWTLYYDGVGTYPWKYIGGPKMFARFQGSVSGSKLGHTGAFYGTFLPSSPQITVPLQGDYTVEFGATAQGQTGSVGAPGMTITTDATAPNAWDPAHVYGPITLQNTGISLMSGSVRITATTSRLLQIVWNNSNNSAGYYVIHAHISAVPQRVKA